MCSALAQAHLSIICYPPLPRSLPAEDLIGQLPAEGDKRRLRAYISNVATWEGARRRGVARALMAAAAREAAAAGVQHLYGGWVGGWEGVGGRGWKGMVSCRWIDVGGGK